MHHANSPTELVWHVLYKSAVHDSDHLLMSWPLEHVERMLLATPTTRCLACLAALRATVTDQLSKMHLQAALKCMASYLSAFSLLTAQAAKLLLITIWVSLAMFATALHTTHPGSSMHRHQIRTLWLAQITECIAHMLWLLVMILGHAASSVHSIAALYSAIMFVKTQHAHIMYVLVFQITCAIMQITPVIMLDVRQTMQLMLPHNPKCYRNFAHPKLRGGRYWRRIRYIREKRKSQPLYKLFVLLSFVYTKLYQFQTWKSFVVGSLNSDTLMRHTTPNEKRPHTNNNDCKQKKHKPHADSRQGNFAPNQSDDSTQYGGGKSSTLEPLWNKLRKTKAKIQQLTTPDLFNPKGRDWLSAHQISSCLTLLLHTKYRSAKHQAAIGSAHMVCSNKTLKVLLHDASQTPLPAHADFTKKKF